MNTEGRAFRCCRAYGWSITALLLSAFGCAGDESRCASTQLPEFAGNATVGDGLRLSLDEFCAEAPCRQTLQEMDEAYVCSEVDPNIGSVSTTGAAYAERREGCGRVLYDSRLLRLRSYSIATGKLTGAALYDDSPLSLHGCTAMLFVAGDIDPRCPDQKLTYCTAR